MLAALLAIVLFACENTLSTPAVITDKVVSSPLKYSFISNGETIKAHTCDTLFLSAKMLAGVSGDDIPFFWMPSCANVLCPEEDTFYVRVEGVPKSVAWGGCNPIHKDTCKTVQVCDTLDCGEYWNTYVHRVTADNGQSGVMGVGGVTTKSKAGGYLPYYANINYTFGVVDSLYFETDSIEWLSVEPQRGYKETRVVLRGKTNAHRVEVFVGGFGIGDSEPLYMQNGTFHDTLSLYMATGMEDYCKTTLFIFGTHNGYEKVEITTAD